MKFLLLFFLSCHIFVPKEKTKKLTKVFARINSQLGSFSAFVFNVVVVVVAFKHILTLRVLGERK